MITAFERFSLRGSGRGSAETVKKPADSENNQSGKSGLADISNDSLETLLLGGQESFSLRMSDKTLLEGRFCRKSAFPVCAGEDEISHCISLHSKSDSVCIV